MGETLGKMVNTPLGKGKIVYELPDGSFVVEFPHGSGQIFMPGELMLRLQKARRHNPAMGNGDE